MINQWRVGGIVTLALGIMAASPVAAEEPGEVASDESPTAATATDAPSVSNDWPWRIEHATGNWWGLRDDLADRGIHLDIDLTIDASRNFRGGLATRTGAFRHLLDIGLTIETEPLMGLEGGTFYVQFQNQNGDNGSDKLTGDFQGFANNDDEGFTQVAQLWYQQYLLDNRLRIKVGKVEANDEFAYAEHASEFIHSSPGVSPTILAMPTYPDPATSINVFVYPANWLSIGFGVYDGATQDGNYGRTGNRGPSTFFGKPSDLFLIGEVGVNWTLPGGLDGRAGAGAWGHTGRFQRFDGRPDERGASGFFLVADQQVYREDPDDDNNDQGVGVFLQVGASNEAVAEANLHLGFGGAWTGLLPSRDEDILGLMMSTVHFSRHARDAGLIDSSHETAIELFYKAQLTPWLSVKPDLQYIINPGGDDTLRDALVGTLRVEVSF